MTTQEMYPSRNDVFWFYILKKKKKLEKKGCCTTNLTLMTFIGNTDIKRYHAWFTKVFLYRRFFNGYFLFLYGIPIKQLWCYFPLFRNFWTMTHRGNYFPFEFIYYLCYFLELFITATEQRIKLDFFFSYIIQESFLRTLRI